MRIFIRSLVFILFCNNPFATSQTLADEWKMRHGAYPVGFSKYVKHDSSRSYSRLYAWTNEIIPRPISISVWYPCEVNRPPSETVSTYMSILKDEEEWEDLPDDRVLSWFYYHDSETNRARMKMRTSARKDAKPLQNKFPVIVYAPSYQASSIENFALCEFLASHGYVVISSSSRGTENRFLSGGSLKDIETQARDIEFLIAETSSLMYADINEIALMGFSFGGISNVLVQMRDRRIKALICLDGSIKYQLEKLMGSPYANLENVNVPFLYMSQKDIPLHVMQQDGIDTTLNHRFDFFDSIKNAEAYYLKFHDLTHPYFSSLGVLFQERDTRQDKPDDAIIAGYRWMSLYSLHFVNAYLKANTESLMFLNRDPQDNGVGGKRISLQMKKPLPPEVTFEDFHRQAINQNYRELGDLLQRIQQGSPNYKPEEWKLNNLGLQLLFRREGEAALQILAFAAMLYPHSANAFDSLAEAHYVLGNSNEAITNYRHSLKLDPSNENARMRLQELNRKKGDKRR